MPLINRCGGGSSFAAMIVVSYPAGGECTCVNGSTTLTADASGNFTFKVRRKGTWTVNLAYAGLTEAKNVEITESDVCIHITMKVGNVYGIRRNVEAASPDWTRTDDAVGFTATASVGTVAGSSSFDNCYPWNGIARETLSTGDVMVKIPSFYYNRYVEGDYEYIKIADVALPGFELHPAFKYANAEKDCIYIGAYKIRANSSEYTSASGASLDNVHVELSTARETVALKGEGWSLADFLAWSAIQMLILVEFATNDSQTAIGYGAQYINDNAPIKTGTCDSVPNLTGVKGISSKEKMDVVWRGLEGLWGNATEWIDGVKATAVANSAVQYLIQAYYICTDRSDADAYSQLSFNCMSVGSTSVYNSPISRMGYDENYPYAMFPSEATGGVRTGYCDGLSVTSPEGTVYFAKHGQLGGTPTINDSGNQVGLFDLTTFGAATVRLMYIPQ